MSESQQVVISLNNLNDLCLYTILSYLKLSDKLKYRIVCKSWKNLIELYLRNKQKRVCFTSDRTFNKYEFTNSYVVFQSDQISEVPVKIISKLCPKVNLLICDDLMVINDLFFYQIKNSSFSKNLEKISFSGTKPITKFDMNLLTIECKKLKYLKLSACDINEDILRIIVKNNKSLEYLNISTNPLVVGRCFNLLNKGLKILNIFDCYGIGIAGFDALLSGNRKTLHYLILSDINSVTLDLICERLKSVMTIIKIGEYRHPHNTQELGKWIPISKLTHLRRLSPHEYGEFVSDIGCIDDNTLITIMNNCQQIITLDIRCLTSSSLLTDRSLTLINVYLPNLQELFLHNCKHITNDTFSDFSNLRFLRFIRFLGLEINDSSLIKIMKWCQLLNNIKLIECFEITNESIISCISVAKLRKNEIINANFQQTSTDLLLIKEEIPNNLKLLVEDNEIPISSVNSWSPFL